MYKTCDGRDWPVYVAPCNICRAKELNIHPSALCYPEHSLERDLIKNNPNMPVYWYRDEADRMRASNDV